MARFLRFALALIIIVIIGVIVLGIIEPKDLAIQRNTYINAPKSVVFDQVVNFRNWMHWDPWYRIDSTEKLSYVGNDGEPGSSYHWVGNEKKTGESDIKNISVQDGQLNYEWQIIQPFDKKLNGYIKVSPGEKGMTKVTWDVVIHYDFPWNASLAVGDMDKIFGGDFEKGLQNLKFYSEALAAGFNNVQIQETEYPAHVFEGVRKYIPFSEIQPFFADVYGRMTKTKSGIINGSLTGLFYKWDAQNQRADVAAVLPVTDTSAPANGAACIMVATSKAFMAVHNGGYSTESKEHDALGKYVAAKGKMMNMVIEEYAIGPVQEKDSTKWVTNIYYLVQ